MKKYFLHCIVLLLPISVCIYSQFSIGAEMTYWDFLSDRYVLNIAVAGFGVAVGYGVKSYYPVLAGATFVLTVYLFAFMFDSKGFFSAFFFAMYTVFLAFAALANIVRGFKDWLLSGNEFMGAVSD